jgi:protein SSD1
MDVSLDLTGCKWRIYENTRIPEHEFKGRQDLRNQRIITLDPEDAKDLDDALSIKVNDDGTYDVGVHIADVSYFVKPNTALDRDARKRATSVYLVQRSVPMLPPMLCEQLCSLLPGQERLAFSVIYTMTKDAKVVKKWFGKTIIKLVVIFSFALGTHHGSGLLGKFLTVKRKVSSMGNL